MNNESLELYTGMFVQNTMTNDIFLVTEDKRLIDLKTGFYFGNYRVESLNPDAWKEIGGPDA